ncbi:hypothetical protein QEH44_gp13 [Arthrobacter phage Shambre1]|uniref:Uncharacterized protein n=1 Tax=Arthrobacter phage Shambre1 TaxID=2927284 RepID=A0A977PSD6_9CAUD|nr:hypothetical protein QEH44_gp13 [Arthrobacter phage Shambre1]UXE04750.1 hypothetical protein SEA_SHAMBRE1_13 [Arthrobacter phage Shambre1]
MSSTNITFASDYTTSGGRTYKAGKTYAVNAPDARVLVRLGKARTADSGTTPEQETDPGAAPAAVSGPPTVDSAGDTTARKAGK